MSGCKLRPYQREALERMKNGCILCGGVGSGKSLTAVAYYHKFFDGGVDIFSPMTEARDLYIITTARKRDTHEWEKELANFLLSPNPEADIYDHKVVIDSWNNIRKYKDVVGAFFIFDEQRVVGSGEWVKSFLKITKFNNWILLSATPGDTWSDYIPVFIANGFYKNKTEFAREHIVWNHHLSFPKVERYFNTKRLERQRNDILVTMDFQRETVPHDITVVVDYDVAKYRDILKRRVDPRTDEPIMNAGGLCCCLRRAVNASESRQVAVLDILEKHPRAIIFYNFDYELDILRSLGYLPDTKIAEWNGHRHEDIPDAERWVYLVQYTAGCEGWNCVDTDTVIFFSQNYSYKVMEQARGRIDRMNTPFTDLYFYKLRSAASIDIVINRAFENKKKFNETAFVRQNIL